MKIDEAIIDKTFSDLTCDVTIGLYDFTGRNDDDDNMRLCCLAEIRAMHLFATALKEKLKEETE